MGLQVAPLWFLAQWTFNLSLSRTSVTSNTILSSTSSLFTFGASCLFLRERFTAPKLAFIVTCIAGRSALPAMRIVRISSFVGVRTYLRPAPNLLWPVAHYLFSYTLIISSSCHQRARRLNKPKV